MYFSTEQNSKPYNIWIIYTRFAYKHNQHQNLTSKALNAYHTYNISVGFKKHHMVDFCFFRG